MSTLGVPAATLVDQTIATNEKIVANMIPIPAVHVKALHHTHTRLTNLLGSRGKKRRRKLTSLQWRETRTATTYPTLTALGGGVRNNHSMDGEFKFSQLPLRLPSTPIGDADYLQFHYGTLQISILITHFRTHSTLNIPFN